jgi:hypothetical protein
MCITPHGLHTVHTHEMASIPSALNKPSEYVFQLNHLCVILRLHVNAALNCDIRSHGFLVLPWTLGHLYPKEIG